METVTLDTLLQVMDQRTYRELKNRGKLVFTKPAPYMEIRLSSIPSRYLHKLTVVH